MKYFLVVLIAGVLMVSSAYAETRKECLAACNMAQIPEWPQEMSDEYLYPIASWMDLGCPSWLRPRSYRTKCRRKVLRECTITGIKYTCPRICVEYNDGGSWVDQFLPPYTTVACAGQ